MQKNSREVRKQMSLAQKTFSVKIVPAVQLAHIFANEWRSVLNIERNYLAPQRPGLFAAKNTAMCNTKIRISLLTAIRTTFIRICCFFI